MRTRHTSAYQLRIYKSAFYSYNFYIFRLFGFGKEKVDVYRFTTKQFIALFAGLPVAGLKYVVLF